MSFIGKNVKQNTVTYTPQAADPTNPTEGMVHYSDGTARAEGLWVYKNAAWEQLFAASTAVNLTLDTGNGHGSTNTRIRRFTNSRNNTLGSFATYTDSATLGASVTINTAGLYSITYCDRRLAGSDALGISVNSASGTTNITTLTYAQGKRAVSEIASNVQLVSIVLYLAQNDIVTPQTNGATDDVGGNSLFSITYIR